MLYAILPLVIGAAIPVLVFVVWMMFWADEEIAREKAIAKKEAESPREKLTAEEYMELRWAVSHLWRGGYIDDKTSSKLVGKIVTDYYWSPQPDNKQKVSE